MLVLSCCARSVWPLWIVANCHHRLSRRRSIGFSPNLARFPTRLPRKCCNSKWTMVWTKQSHKWSYVAIFAHFLVPIWIWIRLFLWPFSSTICKSSAKCQSESSGIVFDFNKKRSLKCFNKCKLLCLNWWIWIELWLCDQQSHCWRRTCSLLPHTLRCPSFNWNQF